MSFRAALVAVAATLGTGLAPMTAVAADEGRTTEGRTAEGKAAARSAATRVAQVGRVGQAAGRPAPAAETPLEVTIGQLTPSTIPERGPVRVSGTVTNTDDVAWRAVNIYAFVSAEPMTTTDELAAAASSDPSVAVGNRIVEARNYDTIDEIQPGDSQFFSFRVARRLLEADTPGVYWFGVHALGESDAGRDVVADGRARTFLPLVPPGRDGTVGVSVVVPLRHALTYAADGSLEDLAGWTRTLDAGGRLRSLVDFGASAGNRSVTWVVDPALLDAVRRLADGNPPRSLAPNLEPGEEDGEATATPDEPSATPTDLPSETPSPETPEEPDRELTEEEQAAATTAQAWLDRLRAASRADEVLVLPYGDLDVSAAARHATEAYPRARARSGGELAALGVRTAPAVASPAGYLSPAGLRSVEPTATVLVTDEMFGSSPPSVARVGERRVVVTSSGAVAGGPGPGDPRSTIGMRQRMLAEAAVRFLTARKPPLVVMLPPDWVPASAPEFFSGLDAPWVDLEPVRRATAAARERTYPAQRLRYPPGQATMELDAANFASAEELIASGQSLQDLLTLNNVVAGTVADQALGSTSYSARVRPNEARAASDRSREWIEERLASVHVRAPTAVTLSSSSGRFASTIRNDLDQPVTVSLLAETDAPLRIEGAARIDVPANGRATVLLNARTNENGIHRVTLVLTDTGGNPLGGTTRISIRSAQVSNVIWLFVGLGLVLLFAAIAIRLFRRVRASLHGGPPSPSTDGASTDGTAGGPAVDDHATSGHDSGSKTPAGATTR